jgi:hypothetical protein
MAFKQGYCKVLTMRQTAEGSGLPDDCTGIVAMNRDDVKQSQNPSHFFPSFILTEKPGNDTINSVWPGRLEA